MTRTDASRAADAVDPASNASGFVVHPSAVSTDTATSSGPVTGAAGPETETFDDLLNRYGIACCDHGMSVVGSDASEEAMDRRHDLWQRLRASVATLEARLRDAERALEKIADRGDTTTVTWWQAIARDALAARLRAGAPAPGQEVHDA